jgi:hypothetical protein
MFGSNKNEEETMYKFVCAAGCHVHHHYCLGSGRIV